MKSSAVRRLWLVSVAVLVLFASVPARAQWAIYFEGSGANLRANTGKNLYGTTFGVYNQKPVGPVALGADFRIKVTNSGDTNGNFSDQRLDSGGLGLRVASRPLFHGFSPYAEALAGFGFFREGVGLARQDHGGGDLQALAGADLAIKGRYQWRVVEFSIEHLRGNTTSVNPVTISTGLMIQFP